MKQAIYVPNFGDWGNADRLIELTRIAEDAGFDGLFLWDHINITGADGLDTIDPTVALTLIASESSHLKFGPIITPLARRRPWKLARELISLDQLSGGRLVFGAGLGEPEDLEFAAFGEESSGKVRAKKLDEGLEVLDSLAKGLLTNYSGQYYHLTNVHFRPRPVQTPRFPVWIAATLPYKSGVKRSLQWDGLFPVVMPKTDPLVWANWFPSLEDFRTAVEEVENSLSEDRGFDFVASGNLGDRSTKGHSLDDYKNAGATWWFHWVDESPDTFRETIQKVSAGPL